MIDTLIKYGLLVYDKLFFRSPCLCSPFYRSEIFTQFQDCILLDPPKMVLQNNFVNCHSKNISIIF